MRRSQPRTTGSNGKRRRRILCVHCELTRRSLACRRVRVAEKPAQSPDRNWPKKSPARKAALKTGAFRKQHTPKKLQLRHRTEPTEEETAERCRLREEAKELRERAKAGSSELMQTAIGTDDESARRSLLRTAASSILTSRER